MLDPAHKKWLEEMNFQKRFIDALDYGKEDLALWKKIKAKCVSCPSRCWDRPIIDLEEAMRSCKHVSKWYLSLSNA